MMPVATDVDHVLGLLRARPTSAPRSRRTAATCCPAPTPRPSASSPSTSRWRVREALLADPQPDAVVRYSELAPYDTEVIEVCLAALGGRPHPAVPLLKGRLAVAGGGLDRLPTGPDGANLSPTAAA